MALPQYMILSEKVILPVTWVPVVPYGVEFTANASPVREVGDSFRLDLELSVRPKLDSGFITKVTQNIGEILTFICPQIRDTEVTGTMRVNGDADAGDDQITIDGGTGALEGDRVIKFANHTGVYLVKPSSTETTLNILPALTEDVPDDTIVVYANNSTALTYSGVFSEDISSRLTISRRGDYMERFTLAFHETR